MSTQTTDVAAWLDGLEEARKAATPGVWRWDPEFGESNDTGLALTNEARDEIVGAYNHHCCAFRDDPTVNDADAALIVAAVNAVGPLVAAMRGVLALAEELRRDAAAEERLPDGTKFAAGLTYAAARMSAVVAAAHTEEGR